MKAESLLSFVKLQVRIIDDEFDDELLTLIAGALNDMQLKSIDLEDDRFKELIKINVGLYVKSNFGFGVKDQLKELPIAYKNNILQMLHLKKFYDVL